MRNERQIGMLVLTVLTVFLASVVAAAGTHGNKDKGKEYDKNKDQQAYRESHSQQEQFQPQLVDANALLGSKVTNRQGEDLGEISDVVLNPQQDQISYIALSYGGTLGIGQKQFAIPWNAVDVQARQRNEVQKVHLSGIRKQQLEQSEGFKSGDWPNEGHQQWEPGMQQQQARMEMERGYDSPRQTARQMKYRRATQIMGMQVKNQQDQSLGNISDMVLDLREGRPVYAILEFGGFLDLGDKQAAVPWSAVDFSPQREIALVDTDKSTLQQIAYQEDDPPNLSNMSQAEQLHERFEEDPYWQTFGYVEPSESQEQMRSSQPWQSGSSYNKSFDADNIVSRSGTIRSVGTFRPSPNAKSGLRLQIESPDGQMSTVYAGPQRYARQKGFRFRKGQQIRVTGSKTTVDGHTVLMATQVEHQGKTLPLRSAQGQPKWSQSLD